MDDLVARLRGNEVSRQNQLDAAAAIEWCRISLAYGEFLSERLRGLERDLMSHRPKLGPKYELHTIGEAADEIDTLREKISRMVVRNG